MMLYVMKELIELIYKITTCLFIKLEELSYIFIGNKRFIYIQDSAISCETYIDDNQRFEQLI